MALHILSRLSRADAKCPPSNERALSEHRHGAFAVTRHAKDTRAADSREEIWKNAAQNLGIETATLSTSLRKADREFDREAAERPVDEQADVGGSSGASRRARLAKRLAQAHVQQTTLDVAGLSDLVMPPLRRNHERDRDDPARTGTRERNDSREVTLE